MIVITRRLAKRLKTVFRQALNITSRNENPIVRLAGGPEGLRVRCGNGQAATEFHLEGEQPDETIYVPFELLADIEGGRDVPVEIREHQGRVTASWRDGSVPRLIQCESPEVKSEDWPPTPEHLAENPPRLLRALADAGATTDPDSTRYSLGCIQLRGDHGKVVATDGRQLLVEDGFELPWDGDVLLPTSKVFGSAQLPDDEPVFVGKVEDWLTLRVGPWSFWWWLNTDGRFPEVESHIGKPELATTGLELSESDRRFLVENLGRLPGDEVYNHPITLDVNGAIAVRAEGPNSTSVTELILGGSTASGEPIRLNSNRRYLARAMQLGFDRLHVFGPKSPVLASDDHRQFVWAVLDADSALKPREDAVQIESAKPQVPPPVRRPRPRTKRSTNTTMPQKSDRKPSANDNGHGHAKPASREPDDTQVDAIQQATALRASLREAVAQTSELIRQLKAERKQNKQLRGALASLRRLRDEVPELVGTG